jgi:hypothetical protein
MAFQEGMRNIRLELIDVMDMIDTLVKDKTITDQQRTDAIAARDFIYVGYTRVKQCLEDKK